MIEYRQMDTNTLFEGELTMKLKGRVLALTMALMLIITSMSGFALAESVSISVNATANADGTTNVSASFSGFPANAGNATSTLEGDGQTLGPIELNVQADGTASFRKDNMKLYSGDYTITAYLDGDLCGSASFTVTDAPSREEKKEESSESSSENEQENTNESEGSQAPSDAENGATPMSAESETTSSYNPELTTKTRVHEGQLQILATITGLPETVAVINMSIEHGTGGDRYTNVETEDGTFKTVFTADSVTPGKYQITAQIKYTDPDKVEVDASLSKAAEFVPAAPTITSEASYTDGTDYTLTWTDDVAYADNTSISYYVA